MEVFDPQNAWESFIFFSQCTWSLPNRKPVIWASATSHLWIENPTSRSLKSLFWMEEGIFVDTYFKIKMKTQQLGPMVFRFFSCSHSPLPLGPFYRFFVRKFWLPWTPFLGGGGNTPNFPNFTKLVLYLTWFSNCAPSHSAFWDPSALPMNGAPWWHAWLGRKNMGFRLEIWNFKKGCNVPTSFPPNLQIHGANLTLDIMVPPPIGHHGKPLLSEAMKHMIYIYR